MAKEKLHELIIWIAEKSQKDTNFGLTKLNKILFAIDFYAFGFRGAAVTNSQYIHKDNGPVAKDARETLKTLQTTGRIKIVDREYYGHLQKRVVPLTGADLTLFKKAELEFIEAVIHQLRDYNATQLSKWTHRLKPWLNTMDDEIIPLETIFASEIIPVEKAALARAQKEIAKWRDSLNEPA
jgi:uncharacterized phage-associated protein